MKKLLIASILTALVAGAFIAGSAHITKTAAAIHNNPAPAPKPGGTACEVCTFYGNNASCGVWEWYGHRNCMPWDCNGCTESGGSDCSCKQCFTWGQCEGPKPFPTPGPVIQ